MADGNFLDFVRREIIGRDLTIRTPFGERLVHYLDWTASGRGLYFVEEYLQGRVLPEYANTHTEDDATGRATTLRLHEAETRLKRALRAGAHFNIVHCGSGTTEAIHRLMQILGVYAPPMLLPRCHGTLESDPRLPVVFIGPYEHHSNLIPWREGICHLVEIALDPHGGIDPDEVERAVSDPQWDGRPKIGCFSAASNVTGIKTDCYEIARRLHRHDALACFDWAAAAPYEAMEMESPDGTWLDAVIFSPHKFVGGPGSSGVLVFHERLYRRDLPPSFGGGGTVAYVGPAGHDFLADIEDREKPGTPGILQAMRAALAVEVRDRVGVDRIAEIERTYLRQVMARWSADERIEVLGSPDPDRRIGIVSFNIRNRGRYLHPRFVTRLLNDLFGLQTRAGCSCAGPYGHRLLGIDEPTSERYRTVIGQGNSAVKPGWVRVSLHYTLTPGEIRYLLDCVDFVAEYGDRFLDLYELHLGSGDWTFRGWDEREISFGLDDLLGWRGDRPPPAAGRDSGPRRSDAADEEVLQVWRDRALHEARERAARLPRLENWSVLPPDLEPLSFFWVRHIAESSAGQIHRVDPPA